MDDVQSVVDEANLRLFFLWGFLFALQTLFVEGRAVFQGTHHPTNLHVSRL